MAKFQGRKTLLHSAILGRKYRAMFEEEVDSVQRNLKKHATAPSPHPVARKFSACQISYKIELVSLAPIRDCRMIRETNVPYSATRSSWIRSMAIPGRYGLRQWGCLRSKKHDIDIWKFPAGSAGIWSRYG